jgi:hypothetical protein
MEFCMVLVKFVCSKQNLKGYGQNGRTTNHLCTLILKSMHTSCLSQIHYLFSFLVWSIPTGRHQFVHHTGDIGISLAPSYWPSALAHPPEKPATGILFASSSCALFYLAILQLHLTNGLWNRWYFYHFSWLSICRSHPKSLIIYYKKYSHQQTKANDRFINLNSNHYSCRLGWKPMKCLKWTNIQEQAIN